MSANPSISTWKERTAHYYAVARRATKHWDNNPAFVHIIYISTIKYVNISNNIL